MQSAHIGEDNRCAWSNIVGSHVCCEKLSKMSSTRQGREELSKGSNDNLGAGND